MDVDVVLVGRLQKECQHERGEEIAQTGRLARLAVGGLVRWRAHSTAPGGPPSYAVPRDHIGIPVQLTMQRAAPVRTSRPMSPPSRLEGNVWVKRRSTGPRESSGSPANLGLQETGRWSSAHPQKIGHSI